MTAPTPVPPPGRLIPIDPRDVPPVISLLEWRKYDPGDWPYVIPKILPVGLVLVYGRPGVAKTTLSDQFETCIAAGVKVAGWAPEPDELGRVLVIDYEGSTAAAIKRSHRIAQPFTLATDTDGDPDDRITVCTEWPGDHYGERLLELDKWLRNAQHAGRPVTLVRIDTLRAFLGPVPQGMNTAQYDSDCLQRLNRLAVELGACVLVVHHPNKAGEVSGSVAIEGSCNATYRLDRKPAEDEGRLVCMKMRHGQEWSWPLLFDRGQGTWSITEAVTDAQAANTGVKRAILDWLVTNGPSTAAVMDAELAGLTTKATLKNARSRLACEGWLCHDRDDVWSLAEVGLAAVARCEVCGEPMTVVHPGQSAHPNCGRSQPAPVTRPPLPWGDGIPGDAYVDRRPGELAEVVPFPRQPRAEPPATARRHAGDAGVCPACGLLILPDAPHRDCDQATETGRHWPGARELIRSVEAVRPRPLKWIAPEGDPRGHGEGRQHRGMPQWEAAGRAGKTVTGYSSRWRPPVLADTDPARLVDVLDKSQAYVAASETVAVCPGPLEHFGPFDCDPRDLGKPNPERKRGAEGLAGIVVIECPWWEDTRIPHPLGPKAQPGQPLTVPSGMLELLWRLHETGSMPRPVVLDSWLGRRHTGLFGQFARRVREARAATAHNSPLDVAVKRGSSVALSQMRSDSRGAGIWRPDWHAAVLGESMVRIWTVAWRAVQAGDVLAGMGAVDEVAWLIPEDASPGTWLPSGYTVGAGWGKVRRKPVQLRADRVDLAGVDPARIMPAAGHPGHVLVSGPLPLSIWMRRA